MTAATVTMTPEQAREFRAAREAELLRLTRMTTPALRREHGGLGAHSRGELLAACLYRRYPLERLNEAIHALHHDVSWPDCPWCAS